MYKYLSIINEKDVPYFFQSFFSTTLNDIVKRETKQKHFQVHFSVQANSSLWNLLEKIGCWKLTMSL